MVQHSSTGTETLLPCPFCGPGQSMVGPWFDDVGKRWAIGCGRCGSSSGRSVHAEGSKEAAIKSWNTRGVAQRPVDSGELTKKAQYVADGIILRRLHEKRIEGYTIDTAKEIAEAVAPLFSDPAYPPQQRAIELLEEAPAAALRALVIEECAQVLDRAAQDWNRIRDPGMANNARCYAKQIRALALPSTDQGGA